MLQTLSDLFLLISHDSVKITNKDISIFYNFIIKKMPQIEQQYPSILSKSLNSSSNLSLLDDKKEIVLNELKNEKNSKRIFVNFQKQILNLFNDLIDYFYNVGIIKLNNKLEKLIKDKIEEKIREKSDKKIKKNNTKFEYNYNKFYQNEIYINKSKKEEIRKILIFFVINGDINFNIYPNDFVNFFNLKNKEKNRFNATQFMKYINNISKIYNESKRNNNKKLNNKSNNNTDIKINNTERKNNKIEEKNNITTGTSYTGIKSFNTDSKVFDLSNINKKIYDKKTYKKKGNIKKNIDSSLDEYEAKFITSTNNNYILSSKNLKEKIESISKEIKSLSQDRNSITDDNSVDNNNISDEDEKNDTIRCETPKKIEERIDIKEKINLQKLFLNNELKHDRYSANKKINKSYSRLTISGMPMKGESKINSHTNKKRNYINYSTHVKNQKKNLVNKNISQEEHNENYYQSFVDDKHVYSIKGKRITLENIKQINKSHNIIGKKPLKEDIINNELTSDKKINNYKDEKYNNKLKIKDKEYASNNNNNNNEKNYSFVNIRTDKNNNKFKELYLYKNLEMHQHLVIYNEDKEEKQKENGDESDNIGCIIN